MEIAFAESFFDDMQMVELESKRNEIMDAIELLLTVPEIGSRRLSRSIEEEYGAKVRKLVVKPFLVIYEVFEDEGVIRIYGLVHQRAAR